LALILEVCNKIIFRVTKHFASVNENKNRNGPLGRKKKYHISSFPTETRREKAFVACSIDFSLLALLFMVGGMSSKSFEFVCGPVVSKWRAACKKNNDAFITRRNIFQSY